MSPRIENAGLVVGARPFGRVAQAGLLAPPPARSGGRKQGFHDGFEPQVRRNLFQPSTGQLRTDRPKVTLAELLRTGGPVLPSDRQVEGMVKDAYAQVLMREPDAGGAQLHQAKAMELARQGASDEEIRAFLKRELASSPEGQVLAAVNEQFESVLGRTPEGKGYWHEQALAWQGQGASLEEIHQAIEKELMASPEYQARQASSTSTSAPTGGATPAPAGGSSGTPPANLKGITPSQVNDAAGFSDQWSLCGPIAAVAASRAMGKDITLEQAREVAIRGGNYSPGAGMKGAESEVRLLNDLGIPAHTETPVNWDKVKEQVRSGKPVIISTPNHYFVIEGYNAQTGKFDCGNSALAMKASGGTQTELSPQELASWGGGAPTAILLD